MNITKRTSKIITITAIVAAVFIITFVPNIYAMARGSARTHTANKMIKEITEGKYGQQYEKSQTARAVIYYTEKDAEYVNFIHGIIKTYTPLIMRDMGISERRLQIPVIIYPTKADLFAAIGNQSPSKSVPMGAYTSGVLIILSPSFWLPGKNEAMDFEMFARNGPIIHELTHLLFDIKTKGNYKEWLSEGTALYYENKYTGYKWGVKKPRRAESISFRELSDNFKYIDERESYRKSYEIVSYIAKEKGETALRTMFDGLEEGARINKLISQILGADTVVLDEI